MNKLYGICIYKLFYRVILKNVQTVIAQSTVYLCSIIQMPFENRFNFVVFIVMLPVMGDPVHVNMSQAS